MMATDRIGFCDYHDRAYTSEDPCPGCQLSDAEAQRLAFVRWSLHQGYAVYSEWVSD
jgi:hypothetical protein